MKKNKLGRTNLDISEITLGGGWVGGLFIDAEYKVMEKAIELALDNGINWIDTAESYSEGVSEKNIGILFQIKDDLLDYSNISKTGKQSFQDLKEGKITYPFFFALKNSSQKEKKQLISFLGNQRLNEKKALALISKSINGFSIESR